MKLVHPFTPQVTESLHSGNCSSVMTGLCVPGLQQPQTLMQAWLGSDTFSGHSWEHTFEHLGTKAAAKLGAHICACTTLEALPA